MKWGKQYLQCTIAMRFEDYKLQVCKPPSRLSAVQQVMMVMMDELEKEKGFQILSSKSFWCGYYSMSFTPVK